MRRLLAAVRHRVGHRGGALLFFAFLDVVYGSLLVLDPPRPGSTLAYLDAHWPPLAAWSVMWIAVGVLCAVQAFQRDDRYAFVGAMAIKFAWAGAHVWAAVDGAPRALASTAIWTMAVGLVAIISSWPEPRDQPVGG